MVKAWKAANRARLPIVFFASKILRPLIRILLNHGVSHGEFNALATWLFVDEAMRYSESWAGKGRGSKARAACVTGLTRKAVDVFWDAASPDSVMKRAQPNRAVRAQLGWMKDPRFTDRHGRPLDLLLTSARRPSFHDLVRDYSGDIHPRAVLDELMRGNAVEMLSDDSVRLISTAYMPIKPHEHTSLLGICVEDLLCTMEHNFNAEHADRHLQKEWFAEDVPAHKVPQLFSRVRKRLEDVAMQEYTELMKHEEKGAADRVDHPRQTGRRLGRKRIGFGIYWFQD